MAVTVTYPPTIINDDFIAAYVEHPGDYTQQEALEIANERDQEAADQLRIDALEGV